MSRKQLPQEFSEINNDLILAHKSEVSSQNLGNGRLKYTPNAPPVKEQSV